MWAGPAQIAGLSTDPEKWWADIDLKRLGQSRPNIFFLSLFWGRARSRPDIWAGPELVRPKVGSQLFLSLHAEWILHAATKAGSMRKVDARQGWRKLPDVGVSDVMRWFGLWLRRRRLREWWLESAVGGRRKRFVEERDMLEGGERESPEGCLVASKWLCWLPVVELVADKLVAAWLRVCNGGERERGWQKPGRGWFFGLLWTRFAPPSNPEIHLHL